MSAVAAPSDRRFRRVHVKPGRKRHSWKAGAAALGTYAIVAVLASYGLYRVTMLVLHSPVLQVNRIVISGNERLAEGEVLAVLSGLRGESLVSTDLDRWRQRLLASPWIRDAALRRSLPSTIEIVVRERQPIGIGRISNEMYLVDEAGVLVDQYGPQYADLDLPIIDGLPRPSDQDGLTTDETRADLAARVIAALRAKPEIARRLSQVDVTDARSASVILTGDPAVIELGDDQFLQRLQEYLELAPTLRERVPDMDLVDVRFDSRIYVRPAHMQKAAVDRSARTVGPAKPAARKQQ